MEHNHSCETQEYHGQERRVSTDWPEYKPIILNDIKETKQEVKEITKDMTAMKITLAEMRVEIKQIVSKSATTTSSIVSTIISIASGIVIFMITGNKP